MQAVVIAQSRGSDSDQPWNVSVDHAALLATHCLTTTRQERLSEPRASHVAVVPPIITMLEGTHVQKQDWLSALYLGTVTRKTYQTDTAGRFSMSSSAFSPICFIGSQSLEDGTMLAEMTDSTVPQVPAKSQLGLGVSQKETELVSVILQKDSRLLRLTLL